MEGGDPVGIEEGQYCNWTAPSPEIVEISEDSKSIVSIKDGGLNNKGNDVYVAVGKNDMHVLKYALDHVVKSKGSRVFLVHVFPSLSYISTPVGLLSGSQLSKDQVQVYIREQSDRRKSLLEKYIQLCNESKIAVDTMLVESNATAKAILELVSVANITNLVIGTKQKPFTRLSRSGLGKGEYVKKNAPEFCEVVIVVSFGKTKMKDEEVIQVTAKSNGLIASNSNGRSKQNAPRQNNIERNFFECVCFSGKFT